MVDMTAAYEAEVGASVGLDEWRELVEAGEATAMGVRDLLMEVARIEQEQHQLATLRDAIVARYDAAINARSERVDEIRSSVETWIIRFNEGRKVSFPDVGTAYLTTRKAKARVADAVLFEDYVRRTLPKVAEASVEVIERFDARGALALTLDELGAMVTPDGKIVRASTGEAMTEGLAEVGVEATPESKTLSVRRASA